MNGNNRRRTRSMDLKETLPMKFLRIVLKRCDEGNVTIRQSHSGNDPASEQSLGEWTDVPIDQDTQVQTENSMDSSSKLESSPVQIDSTGGQSLAEGNGKILFY